MGLAPLTNTCKQCGKPFQRRQKIDGKYRNLTSRTRCLDCWPFLKPVKPERKPAKELAWQRHCTQCHSPDHDRRRCPELVVIPKTKVCSTCDMELPLRDFQARKDYKYGRCAQCRVCQNETAMIYSRRKKGMDPTAPVMPRDEVCRLGGLAARDRLGKEFYVKHAIAGNKALRLRRALESATERSAKPSAITRE